PQEPRDELSADGTHTAPNIGPLPNERPDDQTGFNPGLDEKEPIAENQQGGSWRKFATFLVLMALAALTIILARRYEVTKRLPIYMADRYSRNGTPPPHWLAYWAYWAELL